MRSSGSATLAPSAGICGRANVRCDRFHLTHYPRFSSGRMNTALAPPPWFACDSKNVFLGQTEQRWWLYQGLTSGYWLPVLKLSGGAGAPRPSTSPHLRKHPRAGEQSLLSPPLPSTHSDVFHPTSLNRLIFLLSPLSSRASATSLPQQLPFLCQRLSCHLPPGLPPGPAAFLTPFFREG